MIANPLIRKMECFAALSAAGKTAIDTCLAYDATVVPAKTELVSEGAKPRFVKVIIDGWCCRYKLLENGKRQILAFLLPGDLCDLEVFVLRHMDHSIAAITEVKYCRLTQAMIDDMMAAAPEIRKALWWENLARESMQREWTRNIGQRTAFERIAHLMCEAFVRQRAIGLGTSDRVPFPITQVDIADATGMSNIHVNRVLQDLRSRKLIVLENGHLTIADFEALALVAMFDESYLHLYEAKL